MKKQPFDKKFTSFLTIFSFFIALSILSSTTIIGSNVINFSKAGAQVSLSVNQNATIKPLTQPEPIINPVLVNYTIQYMPNGTKTWDKPIPIMTNKTSNFNILPSNTTAYQFGTTMTINMTGINIDSKLQSSNMNVISYGSAGDICNVILLDKFLNKIIVSSTFSCSGSHNVTINQSGLDAIKNNLRIFGLVSMGVNDLVGKTIPFTSYNAKIIYSPQTYFAKVENNRVTNVIVADQSFVNKLNGTWIQTKPDGSIRGNYAAEGYTYNSTRDQFIPPKPNATWVLNPTGQWNPP